MRYAVLTFGCRVNQADSFGFEEELLSAGHTPGDVSSADMVVVNTCSVTASADQAARQAIRRVTRLNPGAKVVVTGCYATRRPKDVIDLPNVLCVVPNDDKPRLIQVALGQPSLSEVMPDMTTASRFGVGDGSCGATIAPGAAGRTAFTLRVQTGCGEQCSYCIIPTTRGAPRSRSITEVVAEARRVASAGFKEIVVTGVHLGSYGRDFDVPASLADLLRALEPVQPELLFRISSLEPMDCTPDIVSLVATSRVFAPHFHLPLQHAADRMLRAMKRPYTFQYYCDLVAGIRARLPHASIGSDVIVGFPGETDADFDALAGYLERSPLTHLHVFPYSDRPGTAASAMTEKVSGTVVRDRAARLRQISELLAKEFKRRQVGATYRALTIDDGSMVVTGNHLKLRIHEGRPRNEWLQVKVEMENGVLRGQVV